MKKNIKEFWPINEAKLLLFSLDSGIFGNLGKLFSSLTKVCVK